MMNVGSVNPNAYLSCPYFLPYHFKFKILSAVPVFLYKMFVKPSRKPSTPRKHGKQEEEAKQPKFCKQAKQISIFKDPVLPITHCALTIIGGHFLDVEKSEN